MSQPSETTTELLPRRRIPAWAMSCCLHLVLVLILAMGLRIAPRGAAVELRRDVGIALVRQADGQREYFDAETVAKKSASSDAAMSAESVLPREHEFDVDLSGILPSGDPDNSFSGELSLPHVGELPTAAATTGKGLDGSVSTSVFGVTGTGTKFVYVFDRSGSMEGYGGRPLAAAKGELIRSLAHLERHHQFQIIFYNERPRIFDPTGGKPRMVWADEQGKSLAGRFVGGISATGGTRHMDALRLALGMRPDVVFFLTDADEPRLTDDDLRRIRHWNDNSMINAIEFGFGPRRNEVNFLVRLARQNGGQHAYVNIATLQAR